jgi:hypothetical protein
VPFQSFTAEIAAATGAIDLTDNSLAHEVVIGSGFDNPREFVPQNALETHIAFDYLQVGGADSGHVDTYQSFTGCRFG